MMRKILSINNKIIFIIGVIVLLVIWLKLFNRYTIIYKSVNFYKTMSGKKYPAELLSPDFPDGEKVLFIFSIQNSCKACIFSHLNAIKNISKNEIKYRDNIIIVAKGNDSFYYLERYKRVIGFKNQIYMYDDTIQSDLFSNVKLPVFVILDKKNNIEKIWKAEVQKLNESIIVIQQSLSKT